MGDWKDLDNPELKKLFKKYLYASLSFLFILILLIFILGLILEPQIRHSSQWLYQNFGFLGLGVVVFVGDLIISPFPPDLVLLIIGQSSLHDKWFLYVPLLSVLSVGAGICGWFIGERLQHISFIKKTISQFESSHNRAIQKFGFWMVILGALTPLPFSITCWVAGVFKLPFKSFVLASLFRIPRFVLYYWVIFYSGNLASNLRNFF